jgi:hypothetical protein
MKTFTTYKNFCEHQRGSTVPQQLEEHTLQCKTPFTFCPVASSVAKSVDGISLDSLLLRCFHRTLTAACPAATGSVRQGWETRQRKYPVAGPSNVGFPLPLAAW